MGRQFFSLKGNEFRSKEEINMDAGLVFQSLFWKRLRTSRCSADWNGSLEYLLKEDLTR